MSLTSLVICADAQAVQVLTKILRGLDIGVEYCGGLAKAAERAGASQFDAVILDCQDQAQAVVSISAIRRTPMAKKTLIIGLVDGREQVREVFASGANFVIYKPVSALR